MLKKIFRNLCPPILFSVLLKTKREVLTQYGFFGNYSSWNEAVNETMGYDEGGILEKCKESLLKVKNGEAAYERDSVLFDKVEYSWPLLSSLLWIASRNGGKLNLIDFGGSLGSTYFQNISFLKDLKELSWNIVEQEHFVKCGKENFEEKGLKFYYTIDDCLKNNSSDTILFSSVLQYLSEPYKVLDEIIAKKFKYIIVDITGFISGNKDRITIQKVPPQIYKASYPAWFFGKDKFINYLSCNYKLVADFPGYIGGTINIDNNPIAGYRGFIFEYKE